MGKTCYAKIIFMARTPVAEEYEDKLREDAAVSKIIGENLRRLRLSVETQDGREVSLPWLANLSALASGIP